MNSEAGHDYYALQGQCCHILNLMKRIEVETFVKQGFLAPGLVGCLRTAAEERQLHLEIGMADNLVCLAREV